jgi:hypothetical protein
MKNAIWFVALCGTCRIRSFGGMFRLHHQGDKNRLETTLAVASNQSMLGKNTMLTVFLHRVLRLLVTANLGFLNIKKATGINKITDERAA